LNLALLGVLAYRTMKGQGRLADMIGMGSAQPGAAVAPGSVSAGGPGGLIPGGLGGLLSGGLGGALSGGLGDLLNRFQANGHGETAQSWIASGPNKQITPAELEQALGPERVQWLIQQTGMPKEELMAGLSQKLPQAVDQLTPQGRIPSPEEAERLA